MANRFIFALFLWVISPFVVAAGPFDKASKELELLNATKAGNDGQVEQLLKNGVDPEATIIVNYPKPVEFPETPLYWAIKNKDEKLVALLLEHGANPNGRLPGETFLTYTASERCKGCVIHLVKAGADINESNSFGKTPLMLAAINGWVDVVKFLLANGADINAKTDGKIGDSALTYAKIRGNTEVVKVLQAAGAK